MTDTMWIVFISVFVSGLYIQQSEAQFEEGNQVTLSCLVSGTFTFPQWLGPPSLTVVYTNQDDTSGTINPAASAASRLQYASNNKDLILSNAEINDTGDYKCSYSGLGEYTYTLTVTAKPENFPVENFTAENFPGKAGCDCECCCQDRFYLEIILSVIVVVGLVADVICVCLTNLVGENFKDIPIWVWFLCPFTIGLGILIVWLIWKKGGLKQCCNKNNGCKAGFVVGGFVLVVAYLGNQIGSIVYVCLKDDSGNCCKDEDKVACCTDKDLCGDIGIWIWIVLPCIIGVVTMIVGLIVERVVFKAYRTCCNACCNACCNENAGNGDAQPRRENPHPETGSGNQHGGQQGRPHREQPPKPDGATGTTLNGRERRKKKKRQDRQLEDSDSAVSRQQVKQEETGHSLERRPMPAIPPAQGSQGKNNKIQDSKGRGLSANSDDDHLLVGIDTPSQRKGALKKINEDNL